MIKRIHVVGAAIIRDSKCLVAQRSACATNPLKWEFAGGKVEPGEDPTEALRREIHEELGLEIQVGELLGRGEEAAGRHLIQLDVYLATATEGEPTPLEHAQVRWVDATTLMALNWAAADIPILPLVAAALRRQKGAE